MKALIIALLLISSAHLEARKLNCLKFHNNRVRCLAKKLCIWIDGLKEDEGKCIYKDIPINKFEIEANKTEIENIQKCVKFQRDYSKVQIEMLRATQEGDQLLKESLAKEFIPLDEYFDSFDQCKRPVLE